MARLAQAGPAVGMLPFWNAGSFGGPQDTDPSSLYSRCLCCLTLGPGHPQPQLFWRLPRAGPQCLALHLTLGSLWAGAEVKQWMGYGAWPVSRSVHWHGHLSLLPLITCSLPEPCGGQVPQRRPLPLTCEVASSLGHRSASALPSRPEGELFPQHRNCKDRQRGPWLPEPQDPCGAEGGTEAQASSRAGDPKRSGMGLRARRLPLWGTPPAQWASLGKEGPPAPGRPSLMPPAHLRADRTHLPGLGQPRGL